MGSPDDLKSIGADDAPPAQPIKANIDFYEFLHRFSEALAIVQTAYKALQASENDPGVPRIGAEVSTLGQGVAALRAVHEELDLAIAGVAR